MDAPPSSAISATPALAPRPSLEPAVVEAIGQASIDADCEAIVAETLLQHSMRSVKAFALIFAKADDSSRKDKIRTYVQWLVKTGRINDLSITVYEAVFEEIISILVPRTSAPPSPAAGSRRSPSPTGKKRTRSNSTSPQRDSPSGRRHRDAHGEGQPDVLYCRGPDARRPGAHSKIGASSSEL